MRNFAKLLGVLPTQRRKLVAKNLERVTKEVPKPSQIRSVFSYYADYYIDAAKLSHFSDKKINDLFVEPEGYENITKALEAGKGVIVGLPHMGSWEFAGAWVSKDCKKDVISVVESFESKKLLGFMIAHRKKFGITVIPTGRTIGKILLEALRDNRILCLLCDRYIEGAGIEVEFFNEKTILPAGPATLSLRTGAPLLPANAFFKDGKNRALIKPPLDMTRRGNFREDVARITQNLTIELEALIADNPEQWHLMSPNWPSDNKR